jgi:alkaline phosphatase D
MLGNPQLERLEADLLAAQDDGIVWKFVMVPEPIQNLGRSVRPIASRAMRRTR